MASACARAALVGNPSDIYDGAVLAVPLPSLRAEVEVDDAGPETPPIVAAAGVARGHVTTNIPRSVGLAGSSALVIAALRARGPDIPPRRLAEAALRIETDLGITAGPQDRLVQAYEQPLFMDFGHGIIKPLRSSRPLWVYAVWDDRIASPSGDYHAALRRRYDDGDTQVRSAIARLASLAPAASTALAAGDAGVLGALVDDSFDLRRRLGPLPEGQADLVDAVRGLGLPATSPGSGGSVAGVVDDPERGDVLDRLGLPFVIEGI